MAPKKDGCIFCKIRDRTLEAEIVLEDEISLAFLDHSPLFFGHVLLIPKAHHETLPELPVELVPPLFENARRLAKAVEQAMLAEGTFVAMNNRVSQSVPHLHIHVVPRRKGDGLRGFFWPRQSYEGPAAIAETQRRVRAAVERLRASGAMS